MPKSRGRRLRAPRISAAPPSNGVEDSFRDQIRDAYTGPSGRRALGWMLALQSTIALASGAALVLASPAMLDHHWPQVASATLVVILVIIAVPGALRFIRAYGAQKFRAHCTAALMDTILTTSREWVWAVDAAGIFTFSSKTSANILGYQPSELIGRHCHLLIAPEDLALARRAVQVGPRSGDAGPEGVMVCLRHRDGSPVWAEVTGMISPAMDGLIIGYGGTIRQLPPRSAKEAALSRSRSRIKEIVNDNMLLTAFQPIYSLRTGDLIGAEALSRFVTDDGSGADYWFPEATAVGLGAELEFAALTAALTAAEELPDHVYVALNISPESCIDPHLIKLLERSRIPLTRIVLELTERLAVEDYDALFTALAPLRASGIRVAIDDAGAGYCSMRHILQLRPEIIKLDRSLIAGIHESTGQQALGAAMVEFAQKVGASIIAEGIETHADLDAVTALGMTAGQGYLLGRPSIQPHDWMQWPTVVKDMPRIALNENAA